jgi:hypothetical protein
MPIATTEGTESTTIFQVHWMPIVRSSRFNISPKPSCIESTSQPVAKIAATHIASHRKPARGDSGGVSRKHRVSHTGNCNYAHARHLPPERRCIHRVVHVRTHEPRRRKRCEFNSASNAGLAPQLTTILRCPGGVSRPGFAPPSTTFRLPEVIRWRQAFVTRAAITLDRNLRSLPTTCPSASPCRGSPG